MFLVRQLICRLLVLLFIRRLMVGIAIGPAVDSSAVDASTVVALAAEGGGGVETGSSMAIGDCDYDVA